jgi:transcriptional regulator with XRE-family HTH domain
MPAKEPAPRRREPGTVSGQLRSIIKTRNLTPYAVSRAAGVAPSVVTRFVNGERGLSADSMDAVCAALGVRLTETRRGRPAGRRHTAPGHDPE